MTMGTMAACPHCGATNAPGSAFCESCGKAVPTSSGGPKIISGAAMPTTAVGHQMVSEELQKQLKKASTALLAVAIIQMIFGGVVIAMLSANLKPGQYIKPIFYVTIFGVGVIFFALYFWSRKSPLPAAIVGLIVFVTVHLLDALADPTQLARGIIMKIIIIVILVQAIQAGLKYKQLTQGNAG